MGSCVEHDYFNVSDERLDPLLYSEPQRYLVIIVLPVILTLGLFGNVAFLIVYRCVRRMKTRTNIYLANLAVADIFFLVFGVGDKVLSFSLSPIRYDTERLTVAWCVTVWPLSKVFSFASMFFVTMVTVDKYFAVCHPFRVRRSSKRRYRIFLNPVRFVCGAWVTAFVCGISSIPTYAKMVHICPTWPPREKYGNFPSRFGSCEPLYDLADGFSYFFMISVFFSALIPNLYMYGMIIRTLHLRVRTAGRRDTQLRNYVARMLVINGSVFFLCTVPFYSLSLVMRIYSGRIPHWISTAAQIVGQALLYFNSCVNPLIYNAANPRYRTAFVETFRCDKTRKVPTKATDTSTFTRLLQANTKQQTQL